MENSHEAKSDHVCIDYELFLLNFLRFFCYEMHLEFGVFCDSLDDSLSNLLVFFDIIMSRVRVGILCFVSLFLFLDLIAVRIVFTAASTRILIRRI